MSDYVYRPEAANLGFAEATEALRARGTHEVVEGGIDGVSPHVVEQILAAGTAVGLPFEPYRIDVQAFQAFVERAGYRERYPDYYPPVLPEKALEHFVALELLGLNDGQVFVDIASESSPVPEVYGRLTGATVYAQDAMYPPGIAGGRIGGDACAMPVDAAFADCATLHCSLEHFEGDGDRRLFEELARVLKPGGSVCVIPFYLATRPSTQTDPTVSLRADVSFDEGTTVHCAEGWGNRHGRFYDPASFVERVVEPLSGKLDFRCYHLVNAADVDPVVYARFVLTATRPAGP